MVLNGKKCPIVNDAEMLSDFCNLSTARTHGYNRRRRDFVCFPAKNIPRKPLDTLVDTPTSSRPAMANRKKQLNSSNRPRRSYRRRSQQNRKTEVRAGSGAGFYPNPSIALNPSAPPFVPSQNPVSSSLPRIVDSPAQVARDSKLKVSAVGKEKAQTPTWDVIHHERNKDVGQEWNTPISVEVEISCQGRNEEEIYDESVPQQYVAELFTVPGEGYLGEKEEIVRLRAKLSLEVMSKERLYNDLKRTEEELEVTMDKMVAEAACRSVAEFENATLKAKVKLLSAKIALDENKLRVERSRAEDLETKLASCMEKGDKNVRG